MSKAPTAISAPGKVLLAGGYLVLDPAYTGLVFGLSARINVVAREIETSKGVQLQEIVVTSPQFLESQWRYGYHLVPKDGGIKVTQLHVGSQINPNPFVETTLSYALTYITSSRRHSPVHAIEPSRLTILADNDYYSQPHSARSGAAGSAESAPSSSAPSRFGTFPVALKDARKTGLGSSAALVTALAGAVLTHYLPTDQFDVGSEEGKRILHRLAQAAHCAAQGKVGSGFDVAAAVYGSCRYRRFRPDLLATVPEPGVPGFATALAHVVEEAGWDGETAREGVRLPAGVALRMCDVDRGSGTVGMVRQVLAWRAARPDTAQQLWDELQGKNEALGRILADGRTDEIAAAVRDIRELVRAMGGESGVPIEPESQTALLDALADLDGVFNGVVPGAGGFDALALLTRDDDATARRIDDFVRSWTRERGSTVTLLKVKGETRGVEREEVSLYAGWLK